MALDAKLQFRYGFYYAGAFVAVALLIMARQFSSENLRLFLPALLLENQTITAFYFMAGLVLLEKGEGTLEGLVVTPLRRSEYLLSKTLTLTFLALAESVIIVVAGYGLDFRPAPLVAGLLALSVMLATFGFAVIARYDSVTDYLLPSALWTLWLSLPLLHYFDLWPHWILYVVPSQAPLLLLRAAFFPLETWQFVYAAAYSLFWIGLFSWWAGTSFQRFVIRKEGVR
jgi:fluoroquinolone transport system permease protein